MNRAILIVICDFLVSAMLSMMTGMVPAHTGGTGVGLDEQTTRALLAEMHENLSQLEQVREQLREVIRKRGGATTEQDRQLRELAEQIVALRRDSEMLKSARDGKDIAKMTAKDLRKRLETELRERMRAEMELKERRGDLADREKELRELRHSSLTAAEAQARVTETLSRNNAELLRRNEETSRRLDKSRDDLRRAEKALDEEKSRREAIEGRLGVAELRARERDREARTSRDDLARAKKALENVSAQGAKNKAESEQNRARLLAVRRELNKSEKDRAKMRDEIARDNRKMKQLELRVAELNAARKEQEDMLKRGINALATAKKELEEERVRLSAARAKVQEQEKRIKDKDNTIKITTTQLQEANKKLRDLVLQSYGEGVVKLTVDIREELLLGSLLGREQRGGGVFYLPFVDLDGKTFIVGHINHFLGDPERTPMSFRDVTQARLSAAAPGAKTETPLTMPVLLANVEPRLAAVPVRLVGRRPLRAVTVGELRTRGVDGLTLFKVGHLCEYSSLGERCSVGATGEIFIRNSGSRSELRAEPGDFILTKAGEFVGMVAEVEFAQGSRRHGDQVRVFVLPNSRVFDEPKYTFAFAKPRGEKYFTDFEKTVQSIRNELRPQRRHRRR